jgi:hypothetical protein
MPIVRIAHVLSTVLSEKSMLRGLNLTVSDYKHPPPSLLEIILLYSFVRTDTIHYHRQMVQATGIYPLTFLEDGSPGSAQLVSSEPLSLTGRGTLLWHPHMVVSLCARL